jgi:hypothetical protein
VSGEQVQFCDDCGYEVVVHPDDDEEVVWLECGDCGRTLDARPSTSAEAPRSTWPPNVGEFWVVTENGSQVAGPFLTAEDCQGWLDLYALRDLLPGTSVSEVVDTRDYRP